MKLLHRIFKMMANILSLQSSVFGRKSEIISEAAQAAIETAIY